MGATIPHPGTQSLLPHGGKGEAGLLAVCGLRLVLGWPAKDRGTKLLSKCEAELRMHRKRGARLYLRRSHLVLTCYYHTPLKDQGASETRKVSASAWGGVPVAGDGS